MVTIFRKTKVTIKEQVPTEPSTIPPRKPISPLQQSSTGQQSRYQDLPRNSRGDVYIGNNTWVTPKGNKYSGRPPSSGGGGGGGSRTTPTTPTTLPISQPSPTKIDVAIQAGQKKAKYNISQQLTKYEKRKFAKGTQYNEPEKKDITVYTQPTIVQEQTGTIVDTETGRVIPTTSLFYIEPFGESIGAGASISTKRKVTPEERAYFEEQTGILQASTDKRTTFDIAKSKGRQLFAGYQQTESQLSKNIEYYGVTNERIRKGSDILASASPLAIIPGGKEFVSGTISESITSIKEKPILSAVTIGSGFAFGATKNLLITGTTKIKPVIGGVTRASITGAEVAFGTYYAGGIAYQTISAPTARQRGEVLGTGIKEAVLFGVGYGAGYKAIDIGKGIISTRGREFVPLEKLTTKEIITGEDKFLLIPKEKQLKAFKEGRYAKAIGEPSGGFSATPKRFSVKEKFVPQAGTSELPGVYIAPGISPAFTKIPGSGSGFKVPTLKELFAPATKPGVAFFKPLGFRETGYSKVKPYKIGEQQFKYRFGMKERQGYADVPLMKEEAEAILRPKAGGYLFESGKYYTEIEGVKVPIDVFKTEITKPTKVSARDITKRQRKIFEQREYELPSKQSYISRSYLSKRYSISSQLSKSSLSSISSSVKSYTQKSKLSYPSSYHISYLGKSSISRISKLSYQSSYKSSVSNISRLSKLYSVTKIRKDIKFKEAKRRIQLSKQPTQYTPSFTALGLNIRARKASRFAGGLKIRPILQ